MLSRLVLILLLGLISIIMTYMLLSYLTGLRVMQEKAILTSWRPTLINGYYQCPNGIISQFNKSGNYPCGPCIKVVSHDSLNLK